MIRYAITDRHFFPGDERRKGYALRHQALALAAAGVDLLQLREKDLLPADLLALARDLRAALPAGHKPSFLLNGDATLAAEANADGVHLPGGWSAGDLHAARTVFRNAGLPAPILSLTAHTLAEVHAAGPAGADLILFGPVFEKRIRGEQVQAGVGLTALAAAVRAAAPTPLLALGGITSATIPECLAAGAAGIAGIRLFLSHPRRPPSGMGKDAT